MIKYLMYHLVMLGCHSNNSGLQEFHSDNNRILTLIMEVLKKLLLIIKYKNTKWCIGYRNM